MIGRDWAAVKHLVDQIVTVGFKLAAGQFGQLLVNLGFHSRHAAIAPSLSVEGFVDQCTRQPGWEQHCQQQRLHFVFKPKLQPSIVCKLATDSQTSLRNWAVVTKA